MVFPSIPVYSDPPNWPQHQNQPESRTVNPHLQPPLPYSVAGSSMSSIRPNSMADRARMAKLPQPETALKCPRCESTNTKFCYYNNYSLSQPRHFCKTCRRYWTRGGTLRTVPVGGGCRRNKKSKSSSKSKSTDTVERQTGPSSVSSGSCTSDMIDHMPPPAQTQLPYMTSLHRFSHYRAPEIGLNFGGIQTPVSANGTDMGFQLGTNSDTRGAIFPASDADQWRLQQVHQFPFMVGLETPPGIYPFQGETVQQGYEPGGLGQVQIKPSGLGIHGNDQYLGGNPWTDLPGFASSSTTHFL